MATIVSDADDYASEVARTLRERGIRVQSDIRNEKISYKVREHSLQKVPVIMVLGRREAEQRTVTLRRLGTKEQQTLPLAEAVDSLVEAGAPPSGSAD